MTKGCLFEKLQIAGMANANRDLVMLSTSSPWVVASFGSGIGPDLPETSLPSDIRVVSLSIDSSEPLNKSSSAAVVISSQASKVWPM